MTQGIPLIWHVSLHGSERRDDVTDRAFTRGWTVVHIECVRLASQAGRFADILKRGDASQLYKEMHRQPVAVLYDGSPKVRTDPSGQFRDDRAVSLHKFCKYKSFALSLRSNQADSWDSAFDEWLGQVECDGPGDPRVLPFHIFAAREDYELDDATERRRFRDSHKHLHALVDRRKRRWTSARPEARHAIEPQTVRGRLLPDGYHWDVTMRRSPVLVSPDSVWKVGREGYINVHPDGHIRLGKLCQQTWSAKQSKAADEEDRTRSRPPKQIPGRRAGN